MQPAVTHLLRQKNQLQELKITQLIFFARLKEMQISLYLYLLYSWTRFFSSRINCLLSLECTSLSGTYALLQSKIIKLSIFTLSFPLDLSRRSKVCSFSSSNQNVLKRRGLGCQSQITETPSLPASTSEVLFGKREVVGDLSVGFEMVLQFGVPLPSL